MSCVNLAATIFWFPLRIIAPVTGSAMRVWMALVLDPAEGAVHGTCPCTLTIRRSPPTSAASDTDFGADSVTSMPGR